MIEAKSAASDLQGVLAEGLRHHQAGQLAQAERCYRQILAAEPCHADALHLLGVIAHQVGRNHIAVELITGAIGLNGLDAAYHINLGNALRDLGCRGQAVAAYRAALRIRPDFAEGHSNLARILCDLGRFDQAVATNGLALCLKPDSGDGYISLGIALRASKRFEEAATVYHAALCIRPDCAETHYNLGNVQTDLGYLRHAVIAYRATLCIRPDFVEAYVNFGSLLQDLGCLDDALTACRAALRIRPGFAEAYANLGGSLYASGRHEEAAAGFGAALCLKPDYSEAYAYLGNARYGLGRLDAALTAYRAALRIAPYFAEAHFNRGNALNDLGRLDQAMAAYDAALMVKPDYAEALSNRGNALKSLARLDEAIAAYLAALRVTPDCAEICHNLAIAYLLVGRFADGWKYYERRWETKELSPGRRFFVQPQWQGGSLKGRTILLHAEQGMGDTIQFCRYTPLVAAKGGRVILEVQRPLVRLLNRVEGADWVVATGSPLPEFDVHCPLMSLPGLLGTRVDTIPPAASLILDPVRLIEWQKRLRSPNRQIGIVWQGNPKHKSDRDRSVPLALFAMLATVPDVRFVVLQKGFGLDQIDHCPHSLTLSRLGPEFDVDDVMETAAPIAALDLVITIDSAVAHLAGTMGVPVWLLLHSVPDWRWLLDRDDTPWYPTMRLFRQKQRGDWQDVFDRVAAELKAMTVTGLSPSRR